MTIATQQTLKNKRLDYAYSGEYIHIIRLSIVVLLFIPVSQAVTIEAGTYIQPNSTGTPGSTGYYILNSTITVDSLVVNDTEAVFTTTGANRTAVILTAAGTISETLCTLSGVCSIPPVNTVKNLAFRIAAVTVQFAYRYGGIISSNVSSGFSLAGMVPYVLVAVAVFATLLAFMLR